MLTSLAERLQRVQIVHGWTDARLAGGICHPDTIGRSRDDRGEMQLSTFVAVLRRLLGARVTELVDWLLEDTAYCLALRGTAAPNGSTDDDVCDVCDAATAVRSHHRAALAAPLGSPERRAAKAQARAEMRRLRGEVDEMDAEVEALPD